MDAPNSNINSFVGLDLKFENTYQLVGHLMSGIPRKIDQAFEKQDQANKALEDRISTLESSIANFKEESHERFEQERVAMRSEVKRNIVALCATWEDRERDEADHDRTSWSGSPSPVPGYHSSPRYPTDKSNAKKTRSAMKIAGLRPDIAKKAAIVYNKTVEVGARAHTHWLNDGTATECFIGVLSDSCTRSRDRKIFLIGPVRQTEFGALRALREMLESNNPTIRLENPPTYYDESSDLDSGSSADGHATPVDCDTSGHPITGGLHLP